MNSFTGLGRLTKDVDLKYTQTGTAIGRFTLAINRPFKDKKTGEYQADFINCVAFGKTSETLATYVKKGNQLAIEGRIQTGSYENQEGKRVYTTDVVVNGFTFVEQAKQQQTQQTYQPSNQFGNDAKPVDIEDDDLPF